ncbi:MAG: TlyA family RNA methyltransferase [Methyloligellaceae bacterium]
MTDQTVERLDLRLVQFGLVATRSRARDLVKRGFVEIDGETVTSPAQKVDVCAEIRIRENVDRYVSRGAFKLIHALDHFDFSPAGRICLDLGASTGGFTQVLLERGADRIWAVDVGQDQLHPDLVNEQRVCSLEKTNARSLQHADVDHDPIEAIVADLSFISLTEIIEPALNMTTHEAWAILLVKPQFEVGPKHVGKRGIVRDYKMQHEAVDRVSNAVRVCRGWTVIDTIPSPIAGKRGNQEFLLGARRQATGGISPASPEANN